MQEGTLLSATDKFVVEVRGRGGHGGVPADTRDAIVAASMAVVGLQPLVSRETDPTDSAIVGVTSFSTTPPDVVQLQGTVNAVYSAALDTLKLRFEEVSFLLTESRRSIQLAPCPASIGLMTVMNKGLILAKLKAFALVIESTGELSVRLTGCQRSSGAIQVHSRGVLDLAGLPAHRERRKPAAAGPADFGAACGTRKVAHQGETHPGSRGLCFLHRQGRCLLPV